MYNGIGLTTPRGSGTSGYVVRNLSSLRVHDKKNDTSTWDLAPPKHREPDQAILEHERKRKVEVKCLELQDQLEEKGLDEAEIEKQVDQLRQKLLSTLFAAPILLKPTDTHGMAAAKKEELSKMAYAFGTRSDYQEGDAFDREKQEEFKRRRIEERLDRDRAKAENKAKLAEQRAKWVEQKKERDRLLQEQEAKTREEKAATSRDDRPMKDMPPPPLPTGPRKEYVDRHKEVAYRRSPPRRLSPPRDRDNYSRNKDAPRRMEPPPPPSEPKSMSSRPKRDRDSPSRSPSPPPRNRRRVDSRSPSRSMSRSTSRSRSPQPHTRRASPPRTHISGRRQYPPSGPRGGKGGGKDRRGPSPRRRGRSLSRSRSPRPYSSPPPQSRQQPPRRKRDSRSPSRSRSPRSRTPPSRRQTYRSDSLSPPPRQDREFLLTTSNRVGMPPPTGPKADKEKEREPIKKAPTRSRSASTGSSMSVSTRSGRSDKSRD